MFIYTSNNFFSYPRSNLRFDKIKKSLQRIKNGTLPVNPLTVEQINEAFKNPKILESFGNTLGEDGSKDVFFDAAVDTGEFAYSVFSSKKQIELLNEHITDDKLHVLMDATFRTCPLGPFNQLLIIYARIHHQVRTFLSSVYYSIFFLDLLFLFSISFLFIPFTPFLSLYFYLFFLSFSILLLLF